jgi:hypothetical protein
MFARDGVPFRTKMLDYIRREFADVLGPRLSLLREESNLDTLAAVIQSKSIATNHHRAA